MGWLVPLVIVALAAIGLSGCRRRVEQAEADADASTGTNPVATATQSCGVDGCDDFLNQVNDLLDDSATGREAQDYLRDNNVRVVVVDDGRGSRYSAADNRIYLDRRDGVERAALALVHERTHKGRVGTSDRADVQRDTRDVYVHRMLDEEADATVAAVRTREELIAAGHTEMGGVQYPGAEDYGLGRSAAQGQYDAEHGGRGEPAVDAEERARVGDEGGAAEVRGGFESGRYTTDGEDGQEQSYPDHYGSDWDARHVGGSMSGQQE